MTLTTLNLTLTTPNPTLTYPQDDVALLIQYLCRSFVMSLFRSVALLNGSRTTDILYTLTMCTQNKEHASNQLTSVDHGIQTS